MDSVACVSDKLACSVQIPAKVVQSREATFAVADLEGVPGVPCPLKFCDVITWR